MLEVGHQILVTYLTHSLKNVMDANDFKEVFHLKAYDFQSCHLMFKRNYRGTINFPIFPSSVKTTVLL